MNRFSFFHHLTNFVENAQQLLTQPAFRRIARFGVTSAGFTIVELLIVVVIIGVLAAIVVVAYNGVTNRATFASVESDLSNLSKKLEEFNILNGRYPTSEADLIDVKIRVSKDSYRTGGNNFIYCYPTDSTAGKKFGVMAITKVNNTRYIISHAQRNPVVTTTMGSFSSGNDICPALGMTAGNVTWRWLYGSGSWETYVGG